jgi:hypothetical protein
MLTSYAAKRNYYFGFVVTQQLAPLLIAAFGTGYEKTTDYTVDEYKLEQRKAPQ